MHRYIFYLLLVLLPTQLGYHLWPTWSTVLGRYIDYLSPTLFLTDIVFVFMLVSWLWEAKGAAVRFTQIQWMYAVLVAVFVGINIYVSHSPFAAMYAWARIFECVLFIWYIVSTKPTLSSVLPYLGVGVLYSSVLALLQFALGRSVGGILWFFGERTFTIDTPGVARIAIAGREYLRAYATFPHPNVLAGFLAIMIPLFLSVPSKNTKRFFSTAVAVGLVALAVAFGRSAWIVCALGISMYWIAQKKIRWAAMLIVMVTSLIMLATPPSVSDESFIVRKELNTSAIAMFEHSPLMGVGLGNFLVALPTYLPTRTIYFLQPAHNIYLLALSEIGLLGVGMVAWIACGVIRGKKFFHSPLTISLIGLFLLGLVDHYLVTLQQGRLMSALLIGLWLSQKKSSTHQALD